MAATEQFRKDHQELVTMVTELVKTVESGIEQNAEGISKMLSSFSGKLKIHLATEDNALYPQMLNSSDAELKDLAQKFKDEMGGLKSAYEEFTSKYATKSKIEADAAGFKQAFEGIVKALSDRINREENELYRIADERL